MTKYFNHTGGELEATIRLAQPNEASKVRDLLVCQYGKLHAEAELYDIDYLEQTIADAKLLCCVAEHQSDLVGMIWADLRQTDLLVYSTLTVMPAFRGFSLGRQMFGFLQPLAEQHSFASIYEYCLTLDTYSQELFADLGYCFTGVLFNRYYFDKSTPNLQGVSLPNKRTHLLMVKPTAKLDNATFYIPEQHLGFFNRLIIPFSERYSISSELCVPLEADSKLNWKYNEQHDYLELTIQLAGSQLASELDKVLQEIGSPSNLSCNVSVNIEHVSAIYAIQILERLNFFCAGLSPVFKGGNYLIMHRSQNASIDFEALHVLAGLQDEISYIKNCYGNN